MWCLTRSKMEYENKLDLLKGADIFKLEFRWLPNPGLTPYEMEKLDSGELGDCGD